MVSRLNKTRVLRLALALACAGIGVLVLAGLVAADMGAARPAAAFVVNSTEDLGDANVGDGLCSTTNGLCTLRAAVEEANSNISTQDAIRFQLPVRATIMLTDQLTIKGALTITGPGADALTIDGHHETRLFQITTCDNAVDTPVSMSNLTLTNGRSGDGGGAVRFWCTESSADLRQRISLDSVVFRWNESYDGSGGGIYAGRGWYYGSLDLRLNQVVFDSNVGSFGGAIGMDIPGELSIVKSQFVENQATAGGAISFYRTELVRAEVQDSVFKNNSSGQAGGGAISNVAALTITRVTFEGNHTTSWGGAINNSGVLTITGSSFRNNSASWNSDGWGGAIANGNSGAVTVNASTFNANTAQDVGGAIWNEGGSVELTNTTISGNEATKGSGGGIYNGPNGTLNINHVTITANKALVEGGGIFGSLNATYPTTFQSANSIIAGNTLSGATLQPADCAVSKPTKFVSLGHNLTSTAITEGCNFNATSDQKLLPQEIFLKVLSDQLADNGGPTLTHALLRQSPALDAIKTGCTVTTDQRGAPRPIGYGCDIGAVEQVVRDIRVIPGVCGVNEKGDWTNCTDSRSGPLVEFGHKSVAVFYIVLVNAGNVPLDTGVLSAPALGIPERPFRLDDPLPPVTPEGDYPITFLVDVTKTLTEVVSNSVTVSAWNQTLEDADIPTALTVHGALEVQPVATKLENSVSGTEQAATRTFKITASYPGGAAQTLPERSVGFQVTGGTVISPIFKLTDEHGQAEFKYVSRAPTVQAAKSGAIRAKAPARLAPDDMDHVLLWVDLNNNGLPDAGEPQRSYELATAITLVSFTATPKPDGTVALAWTTGAEIDNAGYNVYRATAREGPYAQVNSQLIPGQGNGWGASYRYADTPPDRRTYYYRLEDMDYNGVGTYHDPIAALGAAFEAWGSAYLPIVVGDHGTWPQTR